MPENIVLEEPSFQEKIINGVLSKASSILIDEAEERIKKLLFHKKQIGILQSNLDTLMKRYFLKTSYMDKAGEWYGNKSWWNQALTCVMFVALTSLIGAIFYMAALFSIIAVGMVSIANIILTDHHTIDTERRRRLGNDIKEMETELKEAVERLSCIEDSLHQLFVTFNEELLRLALDNTEFEKKIETLKTEIEALTTTVKQLNEIKDGLTNNYQQLIEQISNLEVHGLSMQSQLKSKVSELENRNKELMILQSQLNYSNNDLTTIHLVYKQRLKELSNLKESYTEQLDLLITSVAKDGQLRGNLFEKLKGSVQKTLNCHAQTANALSDSDVTLSNAEKGLENFDNIVAQANANSSLNSDAIREITFGKKEQGSSLTNTK